jgi:hypothetical protein
VSLGHLPPYGDGRDPVNVTLFSDIPGSGGDRLSLG